MKRALSLILVICFLISGIPFGARSVAAAESADDTILTVEDAYCKIGNTVYVNVYIENNPGIAGMTLSLVYDEEKATLVSVKNGNALNYMSFTAPKDLSSGCRLPWATESVDEEDVKDGVAAVLEFKIADDAEVNDKVYVSLTYNKGAIVDNNLANVSPVVVSGCIDILDYTPGDLNDNDIVDTTDVVFLMRYIAGGYDVTINEAAADVNDDGDLNTTDCVYILRYIAGGYIGTDGKPLRLKPSHPKCTHSLTAFEAKPATCTEEGNIAYWYCGSCNSYFSDAEAENQISEGETVEAALGHSVVVDEAVAPTYNSTGLTEGSHCSVCNTVFVAQEEVPPLEGYSITYSVLGSDTYLAQQNIVNENPTQYNPQQETIVLVDLIAPEGYEFLGWYDAPQTVGGDRITQIKKGSTGNLKFYAHWAEIEYDVVYKLYQTPLGEITNEKYLHYTVSKGLVDLPNPELYNYIFLGWYLDDGTEVTNIPVGTTGDITLNAYWTSKRNLAKAESSLEAPIIVENTDTGVIYFTFELGTIENVPLAEIWRIQTVAGLAQQKSETVTVSISQERASEIAKTISNATVDSATWTLSKDWNETTEVSEEWAEENGITKEEANESTKTESGTYSITSANGGAKTTTKTDGTTTVTYDSKEYTRGNSAEINVKVSEKVTAEASAKASYGPVSASASVKAEVGVETGAGYKQQQETTEHTGTDTTKVDTTVEEKTATWNNEETSSVTKTQSENVAVKEAISAIISNTKGYGNSYSAGGENSESQGFSSTASESSNTSSTLTYFTSETITTTKTYSADGKSEGFYREVLAGTVHVFGVVGYDVATQSYFTYTFNVLDDKTQLFLDYSPDGNFNDYENCVLPFEIPYLVHEYVAFKTACTEGLTFKTDSKTGTATVVGYENDTETDVMIPSYISAGNTAYRVTGISSNAFAGKPVEAIILSNFIKEIPSGAFKNCTSLKQVSGFFTSVGDEAFSGCTSLENFTISSSMTYIGADAFKDVPSIKASAISEDIAIAAAQAELPEATEAEWVSRAKVLTQDVVASILSCGAQSIVLDISQTIEDAELCLDVAEISYFELVGGKRIYSGVKIESDARVTKLKELTIQYTDGVPLKISSENLILDVVNVESEFYALFLTGETPIMTLLRDNALTSSSGEAIVCKVPSIVSQVVDKTLGTLAVSGNVYVCGAIEDIDGLKQSAYFEVDNGDITIISNEIYEQYVEGIYVIHFDANGGNVEEAYRDVYFGAEIGELPLPERSGYVFVGWFTNEGVEVTKETVIYPETRFENNILELCAGWLSEYNVSYNANGGTGNMDDSVHVYNQAKQLTKNTFVKTGWSFAGWNTEADGSGTQYADEAQVMNLVSESGVRVPLYAQWTPVPYKVSWNTGVGYTITVNRTKSNVTGTGVLASGAAVYYGDELTITYTASTGYSFSTYGAKTITVGEDNIGPDKIYASATPINYLVTYDANGGTYQLNGNAVSSSTATKSYDSNYGTLPVPERFNCDFVGWYNGSTKVESNTQITTASDHTLVAKWSPKTSGYWTSGDRNENVSTSGRTEYWPTGLNRDALKEAGYTEFTLKIKMDGKFDSGDWFKADWWFEIYAPAGNRVVEENQSHWDTDWETREFSYTISLDAIRDDGTLLVWYDHSGDGNDDFKLGKLEIWTTAK